MLGWNEPDTDCLFSSRLQCESVPPEIHCGTRSVSENVSLTAEPTPPQKRRTCKQVPLSKGVGSAVSGLQGLARGESDRTPHPRAPLLLQEGSRKPVHPFPQSTEYTNPVLLKLSPSSLTADLCPQSWNHHLPPNSSAILPILSHDPEPASLILMYTIQHCTMGGGMRRTLPRFRRGVASLWAPDWILLCALSLILLSGTLAQSHSVPGTVLCDNVCNAVRSPVPLWGSRLHPVLRYLSASPRGFPFLMPPIPRKVLQCTL